MPLTVLSTSNLKILPLIVFNVGTYMTIERDLRFKIAFGLFGFFTFIISKHCTDSLPITGILLGFILPIKKRERNRSVLRLKRRISFNHAD